MPLIVLHVGAFKTGTSFLQHTLAANRGALARDGVLYPGKGRGSHFTAARELNRAGSDGFDSTEAWDDLVDECRRWTGHTAILSAENLSMSRPDVVERVAQSIAPHPVRVVYGARDLARSVPSQWQTQIRDSAGHAPSYRAYVDAVSGTNAGLAGGWAFWRTHHWAEVLRRWAVAAADADLSVITVPPSGTPESVLWQRFGQAVGVDADRYPLARMTNASLGGESAEVVRRVSAHMAERYPARDTVEHLARNRAIRALSRRVLAAHRGAESRVVFPPRLSAWATSTTDELVEELRATGPKVHGALDDLRPRVLDVVPPGSTDDPSRLPRPRMLDAARYGVSRWGRPSDLDVLDDATLGVDERLDIAVDLLVGLLMARAAR